MSKRYSPEFKERVVSAVLDQWRTADEIESIFGVPRGTFGHWLKTERDARRERAALERAKSVMLPDEAQELAQVVKDRDRLRTYSLKLEKGLEQIWDILEDLLS